MQEEVCSWLVSAHNNELTQRLTGMACVFRCGTRILQSHVMSCVAAPPVCAAAKQQMPRRPVPLGRLCRLPKLPAAAALLPAAARTAPSAARQQPVKAWLLLPDDQPPPPSRPTGVDFMSSQQPHGHAYRHPIAQIACMRTHVHDLRCQTQTDGLDAQCPCCTTYRCLQAIRVWMSMWKGVRAADGTLKACPLIARSERPATSCSLATRCTAASSAAALQVPNRRRKALRWRRARMPLRAWRCTRRSSALSAHASSTAPTNLACSQPTVQDLDNMPQP